MRLDQETRERLERLDAVRKTTETRIYYTDGFRERTMERYRNGDKPSVIFRDAGLDPKLIGGKRIERCIARWRHRA